MFVSSIFSALMWVGQFALLPDVPRLPDRNLTTVKNSGKRRRSRHEVRGW